MNGGVIPHHRQQAYDLGRRDGLQEGAREGFWSGFRRGWIWGSVIGLPPYVVFLVWWYSR